MVSLYSMYVLQTYMGHKYIQILDSILKSWF